MRVWMRAVVDVTCGLCTARIRAGAPVQQITLSALKRPLWRCDRCVPGGAPPDLPALVWETREQPASSWTRVRTLAEVVDFKAKAAGE